MNILLVGYYGHMGQEVRKICENEAYNIASVSGVDAFAKAGDLDCVANFDAANANVDCIIDFSHHSNTNALLEFATRNKLPLVLATTGQTDEELNAIKDASKDIPLFFAANYSVGVALLILLAKKTAAAFPAADIEIIEKHHNRKIDAPSGTAIAIANAICEEREDAVIHSGRSGHKKREKNEIGIHSVRMGNLCGEHEVIVATETQTITLKHEAHSRSIFAEGAVAAAKFIVGKPAGLYDMNSMVSFEE